MSVDVVYPPCKKCGASHGMGIEDMQTGVITPIDICRECLWEPLQMYVNNEQVMLTDNQDEIDELLEKMKRKL